MTDLVNHPPHYTNGKIEAIDAIEAAVEGLHGIEAMCIGNAIKYLFRTGLKHGNEGVRRVHPEDVRKAIWYLKRSIGE